MEESSGEAVAILAEYRKIVWKELSKYLKEPRFPRQFSLPLKFSDSSKFHWEMVRDYPTRKGKYLRPTLLLLVTEALGCEYQKALKTAVAMQLSEEWLLIHDDLEDNSCSRRGKPTLNKLHGFELATNAGDTLHVIMWKAIADIEKLLPIKIAREVREEFLRILFRTTVGQTAELLWTKKNILDFSDEDWFYIADGKTSYYTIAGPMRLGAIVAGASKKELDKIADFGLLVGRSFQITDDILDLTSDFCGLKKQQYNDLYEGKRTIITGHLYRKAKKGEREKIKKIFAKKREGKSEKEINWIVQKIKEYGSIQYAKKIALEQKKEAMKIFENELKFLKERKARTKLLLLLNFIIERKY